MFNRLKFVRLLLLFKGNSATIEGGLIKGKILYDKTKEGLKLHPKIVKNQEFVEATNEKPFSESQVGFKKDYETKINTILDVNKVISTGEIILQDVDWDKNKTDIIGKFKETTYKLSESCSSWNNHHQFFPKECLTLVALEITLPLKVWVLR